MQSQTTVASHSVTSPSKLWDYALLWLWWSVGAMMSWATGWVLGTLAGGLIVANVDRALFGPIGSVMDRAIFGAVLGMVVGVFTGIVQWLIVRQHIPKSRWWVLATIVGLTVGLAIGMTARWLTLWSVFGMMGGNFHDMMLRGLGGTLRGVVGGAITGVMTGLAVGIAQWLVIHRHFSRSVWWIVATFVAMVVGMAVSGAMETSRETMIEWATRGSVAAMLYSAITGLALIRLIQINRISPTSDEVTYP